MNLLSIYNLSAYSVPYTYRVYIIVQTKDTVVLNSVFFYDSFQKITPVSGMGGSFIAQISRLPMGLPSF